MKYRTLIRDVMMRSWVSRLGVAYVAVVFLTMGGARGMDQHSLAHATHVGHGTTNDQARAPAGGAESHAGHHAAPSEDGEDSPTTECTCVGPCQGGSAPSDPRTASYQVAGGEIGRVRLAAQAVRLVDRDPTSHLLPFPNPPPSRV